MGKTRGGGGGGKGAAAARQGSIILTDEKKRGHKQLSAPHVQGLETYSQSRERDME